MFDVRRLLHARSRRDAGALARADAALERGDPAAALAILDAAAGEPQAAVANKRGVALVALGRRDDALAAFCSALDLDPRSAPALVNVGNLLLEDGHALDAIDHYDAAILADEHYALAHRNRGVALKRLGRRSESVAALRTAARCEGRRRRS